MRSMGSYSGAEFGVEDNVVAFELGEVLGIEALLPLGIDYAFLLISVLVNFAIASGERSALEVAFIDISVVIVHGNTEKILVLQVVGYLSIFPEFDDCSERIVSDVLDWA